MEPKKKFGLRRILSVVLCLSMLLSPVVTLADSVIEDGIESIAEPESILIQKAETKTVYKLVENYTLADLVNGNKTFMIISTDVPGAASAFGGTTSESGRYLKTLDGLKVFEVPTDTASLSAGKYVTNTFGTELGNAAFGEWKFQAADSGKYYMYTTTKTDAGETKKTYLAHHNNGGNGQGYHKGYFMGIFDGELTWGRTVKFTMAGDKVDLSGLYTVYSSDSSEVPYGRQPGENGYLSFGSYNALSKKSDGTTYKETLVNFNIVTNGSASTRAQFYEKVGSSPIPEIKGYLYSNKGTVAVNTGKFAPTGAYIHLYVDGKLTRVPVTTDMLSGADLTKAGTYTNVKVSYNGVQLADNFTLEVKSTVKITGNNSSEAAKNSTVFALVDPNSTNSFVQGGYIHIAESQNPGYVRLLTTDGTNLGSSEYYAYEIFVDGEKQLVINNAAPNSIWVTKSAGHTGLPNAKFWQLRAFNYGERYLRYNGTDDLGKNSALVVSSNNQGWEALWHERGERTGLSVFNPSGEVTVFSNDTAFESVNKQWRTMYYNCMIGTFGLRVEQANSNAVGYRFPGQVKGDLRENSPYDRAYYYARTSEYANVNVYLSSKTGSVSYGASSADSPEGLYLVMTVNDAYGVSHITNIPVTLDMLTYNNDSIKTKQAVSSDSVYKNVTVTYQGIAIANDLTITVKQKLPENNYPAYPAPGSVDITKELNEEEYNYLETGLTEVNLTLTGVPDASGADVVLVLDNSGSMAYSAAGKNEGAEKSRRVEMINSIYAMLRKFAESIDGYKSDISVSILTFDGYTLIDGNMFVKNTQGTTEHSLATTYDQPDTAHFLTPSKSSAKSPDIADRFIHSSQLTEAKIKEIAESFGKAYTGSGTNYDQGLHLAYETLVGKQKLNAQQGTKRNPYVIFMSDGCTWQYNYVAGGSEVGYYSTWDQYLNGSNNVPAANRPSNTARYEVFGNSEGKHWMAEAIKGDTDSRYKIINPNGNPDKHYAEWVNGLGAEIYVVGFGMAADKSISRDTAVGVLRRISSGNEASGHFYDVKNVGEIENVFTEVATKIRAASGAVFEDKLGEAFDLQMASTVVGPRGPITLDPAPSIEVLEYITYRIDEVGTIVDNVHVTEDMVGTIRQGYENGTLIEQITFNPEGTEAYSTLKSGNILGKDGIIDATTFKYNTNKNKDVVVDSNSDGKADYLLPPETFAWLVGDIPQSRYELHYDVYLEGSMEGEAEAGEGLLTNEYAVLKYKNYIGNDCSIEAPKPNLPWETAKLTYKYYLADEDGNPINEHGQIVSFENAKEITVSDNTIDFNLNATPNYILGRDYVPDGYIMFDYDAEYHALAHSASAQTGEWAIVTSDGLNKTTYVESGSYTGANATTDDTTDDVNANYRNTTVWFAVIPNNAKVSYKYYLVNEAGQPIDKNGNVVGIADAYVIEGENLSGSKTFKIGEGIIIDSESVTIPNKYALYDSAAEYMVKPSVEGPNKGFWQITKGANKAATTYVTSAGTHAPMTGNVADDADVNYRDTTVWFAVYQQTAELHYKYYLVNEAGQPIDADGNVLSSYKDAVINIYGGSKDFLVNVKETVSVNDNVNILSSERYDIFDSGAKYEVTASGVASNKGSWTITSTATIKTTYVESGKISTTGNTENNENANYRNTTVWFALKLETAKVAYKYYLVNENGQPIDTKGNVISDFKDAQIAGLGGSYTFNVDSSLAIPVGNPSSKYTVYDPDAKFTVFANGAGASMGNWKIVAGRDIKTTYVVSGSVETTEDIENGANYRDTEVWFALVLPKAKVTYKYYLVNENGQPIDATGNVLANFKDAQIANYGSSKEFYVGNSAIIKVTDETDISTSKYTIFDDKAEYTVFAGLNSVSTGSWKIESNKTTKTTYVESAGTHNPTIGDTNNNSNANYRDTTVWFALVLNEAKVTYKYYLVNINGEPINANGVVISDFKNAEIAGLGGSKEFYVDSSMTVDVTEGNVPSKYEIFDPLAKYTVTASSEATNKGKWEITIGETKKTTYVVSGSVETTENIENGANYRNTTVWFALVPKNPVADDTVVIDYGIPVDVDVLANDNGSTLLGYTATTVEDPSLYSLAATSTLKNFKNKTKLNGTFGTFTTTANNEIRYELTEMQMTSFDRITYGANYTGSDYVNGNYYANLTVIPATLIYFEDDFVSFTVNNYSEEGEVIANSWTTVGTEKDDVQRDDRVGEISANVYGNDGAYVDSATYSFGSAQMVTVERTDKYDENGVIASSTGRYATATFTFVGKGFDVISYTTNKTGTIAVQVFPYESLDAAEPKETAIKSTVVDTYYGYKYAKVPAVDKNGNQLVENGKVVYEDRWVPAESDTEDGLYQVPVIKWSGDTYGKYKVVITASYNWIFDHGQYGGSRLPNDKANATREGKYDFYLDAIRIYDPANGGADNDVIKNAYIADGEYMPVFKELRNILISDVKGFAANGSNVNGAVYIDNTSDSTKKTYTFSEYKAYGPNNEVYLANGNAVAFTVDTKGYASVQLAAKLAKGTGKLKIKNVTNGLSKTLNIETATDLYYALDDILADNKANTIVLQNIDGNGIISITNLKFTKKATANAQVQTVNAVYMNAKTAQAAIDYLNATQAQPEIYSVKTMKRSVKAGQAFTVTVTTNSDAEYVVVNGETFTKYTENKSKDQRVWKVTITLDEKGMAQINANAYSANDVASRTISTTVKVTKTQNFAFNGIFDGFFGGLLGK